MVGFNLVVTLVFIASAWIVIGRVLDFSLRREARREARRARTHLSRTAIINHSLNRFPR